MVRKEKQQASTVRFRYTAKSCLVAAESLRGVPEAMKVAKKGLSMVIPLMVMDWGTRLRTLVARVSVLSAQESSQVPEAEFCSIGVASQPQPASDSLGSSHTVVSSQGVEGSESVRVDESMSVELEHAVIFVLPFTAALWLAVICLYMAMMSLAACLVALVAEWRWEFAEREAMVEEVILEAMGDMVAVGRNGRNSRCGRGSVTVVDSK